MPGIDVASTERFTPGVTRARGCKMIKLTFPPPSRVTHGLGAPSGLCYKALNRRRLRGSRAMLTSHVMQTDVQNHVTLIQLKHVSAMFTDC